MEAPSCRGFHPVIVSRSVGPFRRPLFVSPALVQLVRKPVFVHRLYVPSLRPRKRTGPTQLFTWMSRQSLVIASLGGYGRQGKAASGLLAGLYCAASRARRRAPLGSRTGSQAYLMARPSLAAED